MSKTGVSLGICLGGIENGKIIRCNDNFYYALVGGDIFTYQRIDLKFKKGVCQPHFQKDYILNQPFNIYVPESEYDNYEVALKLILSKWMEAEWMEV